MINVQKVLQDYSDRKELTAGEKKYHYKSIWQLQSLELG
jgi:hypothetical protein